jgi:RNA polymerase sigma-70 factor, ECF subfamily
MKKADNILIAGIKVDDYSCFNQLYIRYYGRLCLYVYKLTQNHTISEDIVQELFIRLWMNRAKLEIKGNIAGYMYQSSRNSTLNYLRAENNRKKTINRIPFQEESIDENLIEQVEFSTALYQCIEQLPARSKDVFMKSRFDGLKQQEISEQLGISVKTIKNQIWKSLQFLKACLELHEAFEH